MSAGGYRSQLGRQVQELLEIGKRPLDQFGLPKIGNRIGDGIVVLQFQQWAELVLIEFAHALLHILSQHEVEKRLLFAVEVVAVHCRDQWEEWEE